ncbi:MAG: hypothetical protein ABL904_19845, partial [Hyphomicrobiaceae bacterium]
VKWARNPAMEPDPLVQYRTGHLRLCNFDFGDDAQALPCSCAALHNSGPLGRPPTAMLSSNLQGN